MADPTIAVPDQHGRLYGETVAAPVRRRAAYHPVTVHALLPETVLGFQVYIRLGDRSVLTHGEAETFTAARRERLLELKQTTVFVRTGDLKKFHTYLEQHLPVILHGRCLNAEAKAQLVYSSARAITQEILAQPEDPRVLERSRRVADATVEFLLSGKESFLTLMATCSFDYRTYTHSVNVSIFSVALAQKLGFSTEDLLEIGTSAIVHDIGKTRISPAILNKPSPLNESEWRIMKRHPEWGVEVLKSHSELTPRMERIVRNHHEKLDGSGYPDGLHLGEIDPVLRIVTICDIFDALTTNRAYKGALSTYETLQLMRREMKGQVDFDVLKNLIQLLKREE